MFAQMKKDIDAIMLRDPAAKTRLEAALCYPGLHAIWLHRIAHHFYLKGWVVSVSYTHLTLPTKLEV